MINGESLKRCDVRGLIRIILILIERQESFLMINLCNLSKSFKTLKKIELIFENFATLHGFLWHHPRDMWKDYFCKFTPL